MLFQVKLLANDRRYHRFVWSKAPQDPVTVFEFCCVLFGNMRISLLVGTGIESYGRKFVPKDQTELSSTLTDNFYVDDLLLSIPSEESACSLRRDL